ncbi:MAG: zinc-ribbon domain-containing protein [Clostridia bacterium]|nr:zinc-ribbon domain-containing protein [Clostridia bacterium]
MFGKSEKLRNIIISASDKYVMWNIDLTSAVRDTTLEVAPGCLGIYIVNGGLKSVNTPGRWIVKSKEEEKFGYSLQLIGVNADKTYDIPCGVGGIPFKDFELNCETAVGLNGHLRIRINQPWALYTNLGKTDITVDDIDEYIRSKTCEVMTTRLAEVLQKYDYQTVNTQLSLISTALTKILSEAFSNYGVGVEDFSLKQIFFNEEYKNKRTEYFDNQNRRKEEKLDRREKERAQRAEIDALNSLIGGMPTAPSTEAPAQNANQNAGNAGINQPVQYCPRCGAKLSSQVQFCPGCGKKLS